MNDSQHHRLGKIVQPRLKRETAFHRPLLHSNITPGISRDPLSGKERKLRKGPWIVGGLAIYSFTAYGSYLYSSLARAEGEYKSPEDCKDVSYCYNETAKNFDNEVGLTEKLMGIGWLRQSLTKRAFGDVLEVSAGTGRNVQYYDLGKCKSITMVDQSEEMLKIAKKKFRETHPKYDTSRFLIQSVQDPIPSSRPPVFDTVIQTMGICSIRNPSAVLAHLGSITKPSTGQILLLEHGRSYYGWLNRILDKTAAAHADKHGCWWNRDIGKIIEDSGLEPVKIRRYHLGTTWWVELKPRA